MDDVYIGYVYGWCHSIYLYAGLKTLCGSNKIILDILNWAKKHNEPPSYGSYIIIIRVDTNKLYIETYTEKAVVVMELSRLPGVQVWLSWLSLKPSRQVQ